MICRFLLVLATVLASGTLVAAPPLLLFRDALGGKVLSEPSRANGPLSPALSAVQFDAGAAFALRPDEIAVLELPRNLTYNVTFERTVVHPSGNRSWIGRFSDFGSSYPVVVTQGSDGAFGHILSPEGEFHLEANATGSWLLDLKAAALTEADSVAKQADYLVPPAQVRAPMRFQSLAGKAGGPASTVDVLFVYTPNMVSRLGSVANVQARLDQLIALSNQAYVNSQISLSLRLVRIQQVDYSETTNNSTALFELTGSDGSNPVPRPPGLAGVEAWRNAYGADLVFLMRSYRTSTMSSCGIAWLSVGRYNNTIYSSPDYGYGVVADGQDGSYYCGNYTFTHEAGHLFGSAHDRITENKPTGSPSGLVYPYAFGYGVSGAFHTIMAYGSAYPGTFREGRFSNPYVTCAGHPCGKAVGQPDEAYNALAIDNTRGLIDAYRASVFRKALPAVLDFLL